MTLSDVSIRRPVFAFMMSAALLVLGLFSYRELGVDLMPKTDYPMVFINTVLPGASAEEIETQITKPIEEVVNTISGVDEIRASSDTGFSRCSITFVLEKNIDVAVQDVRDKVATIVARFPYQSDLVTHDGGVHQLFTISNRTDAPGCTTMVQPDFQTAANQNNLIFRQTTPTFGEGLMELVTETDIVNNMNSNLPLKQSLGITGHPNYSGDDGTINRFGWKAQVKSLVYFSGEA